MWRQSVLLAVSSFRMEAMAAGGFAGEYERWMDMADLPPEEEEKELNDLTAEARNKFTEEENG